jgi:mono/diheme cytochrome c family protein
MRLCTSILPILAIALTITFVLPHPAFAQDGAAIFKAKCATCHGPEGDGKIGPAVKGTTLTADQIAEMLTKGNDARKPPHKKPLASLSANDAKAVADFVKTLK